MENIVIDTETENGTALTDKPLTPGRLPSERLNMDIIEEMKNRSSEVDLYREDKRLRFVELRARGASYQDIADILHCAKSTLIKWNNELSDEITQYKDATKNDILYDYQVARDNRLRYFAELYRDIKNELSRRSFRTVPSDKLYAMLEKCSKHIDELSGEKREERQSMSIIASSHVETVQTAVKCVRGA